MPNTVNDFSDVYEKNSSIMIAGKTLMNEFSYSPKLMLSWVFGPKPKLLRDDNWIGDNKLLQTVYEYVFIDFGQARQDWDRPEAGRSMSVLSRFWDWDNRSFFPTVSKHTEVKHEIN